MSLDDAKHTETLKVWLTEREFVDFMRLATLEDRKPSELARVVLRKHMYGILERYAQESKQTNRAE